MSQQNEEWRPIPGHDGYEASNLGRIRSWKCRNGRGKALARAPNVLKQNVQSKTRYHSVELFCNGSGVRRLVHHLILESFVGMRTTARHEARHVHDNDRSNNAIANLAWGTRVENMADKVRHGTVASGERNGARLYPHRLARGDRNGARLYPERLARGEASPRSKLTDELARSIFLDPRPQRTIAADHGIEQGTVGSIKSRETWAHATAGMGPPALNRPGRPKKALPVGDLLKNHALRAAE